MGERNLTLRDQILEVLETAVQPLSAADIRRRLEGDIDRDQVSSRLAKLNQRGLLITGKMVNQAASGPREITSYATPGTMAADIIKEQGGKL